MYAGKPESPDGYTSYEIDGITVYILNDEVTEKKISIDVKGIGPFKQFVIEGF